MDLFAEQFAYPFNPFTPQKYYPAGNIGDNRYADLAGYTGCNLIYKGLTGLEAGVGEITSQRKGDDDLIFVVLQKSQYGLGRQPQKEPAAAAQVEFQPLDADFAGHVQTPFADGNLRITIKDAVRNVKVSRLEKVGTKRVRSHWRRVSLRELSREAGEICPANARLPDCGAAKDALSGIA